MSVPRVNRALHNSAPENGFPNQQISTTPYSIRKDTNPNHTSSTKINRLEYPTVQSNIKESIDHLSKVDFNIPNISRIQNSPKKIDQLKNKSVYETRNRDNTKYEYSSYPPLHYTNSTPQISNFRKANNSQETVGANKRYQQNTRNKVNQEYTKKKTNQEYNRNKINQEKNRDKIYQEYKESITSFHQNNFSTNNNIHRNSDRYNNQDTYNKTYLSDDENNSKSNQTNRITKLNRTMAPRIIDPGYSNQIHQVENVKIPLSQKYSIDDNSGNLNSDKLDF